MAEEIGEEDVSTSSRLPSIWHLLPTLLQNLQTNNRALESPQDTWPTIGRRHLRFAGLLMTFHQVFEKKRNLGNFLEVKTAIDQLTSQVRMLDTDIAYYRHLYCKSLPNNHFLTLCFDTFRERSTAYFGASKLSPLDRPLELPKAHDSVGCLGLTDVLIHHCRGKHPIHSDWAFTRRCPRPIVLEDLNSYKETYIVDILYIADN